MRALIDHALQSHRAAIEGCVAQHADVIEAIGRAMAHCLERGNKILFCGNGGSACDAMHAAGELVGRFVSDRRPLPAIALTADPGILTAIGNDYGFEEIFARQVRAHGRPGDLLVGISTSGQSRNVLAALAAARELRLHTVLLTGEKGKNMLPAARPEGYDGGEQWIVPVPSAITAHIQETHIFLLQLWIAIIESILFKQEKTTTSLHKTSHN